MTGRRRHVGIGAIKKEVLTKVRVLPTEISTLSSIPVNSKNLQKRAPP